MAYDFGGAHILTTADGNHLAGVQSRCITEPICAQGPLLHGPLQGHPEINVVALQGPRAGIWRKKGRGDHSHSGNTWRTPPWLFLDHS